MLKLYVSVVVGVVEREIVLIIFVIIFKFLLLVLSWLLIFLVKCMYYFEVVVNYGFFVWVNI